MSLSNNINLSLKLDDIKSLIYDESRETGLYDNEKSALLNRLQQEEALLSKPSFMDMLEHALFVADNKYNRDPIYKDVKNCIYDCIV